MGNDRRADAAWFGYDFQVNAAIILMLDHIKALKSLRLESKNEDIDIELNSGNHVLAQAKSVVNSSTDFRNVRKNLNKALKTLSEGSQKVPTEKLIYITNSPNPFDDDNSRSIFWGLTRRRFDTLPEALQKIINNYLSQIKPPLDTDKLIIQVVPFETDDERERYKAVLSVIDEFIGDLNLDMPGIVKQLHQIWREKVFINGTKKDDSITLSKKSIIWPIIVIVTNVERTDNQFFEQFDSAQYDEIVRRFKETVESCCERVEFFTKILSDYNDYKNPGEPNEKITNFVKYCWHDYSSEFEVDGIDSETVEGLTKVVIYNVLQRRFVISKIKRGVSL